MKKAHYTTIPGLLAMAALVAACSSAPTTTSLLDQTRGDYMAAQSNPMVSTYAAREWRDASAADEINENIRVMREELDRANQQAPKQ